MLPHSFSKLGQNRNNELDMKDKIKVAFEAPSP
jgi:hypothetical protein